MVSFCVSGSPSCGKAYMWIVDAMSCVVIIFVTRGFETVLCGSTALLSHGDEEGREHVVGPASTVLRRAHALYEPRGLEVPQVPCGQPGEQGWGGQAVPRRGGPGGQAAPQRRGLSFCPSSLGRRSVSGTLWVAGGKYNNERLRRIL